MADGFAYLIFTNVKKKLELFLTRAVQNPCLKLVPSLTSNSGSAPAGALPLGYLGH